MGCASPDADLDLVAVVPGPGSLREVRARVGAGLPEAGRFREVTGARVPGLRFRMTGPGTAPLAVDLVVVPSGDLPPPEALERRAELGDAAAVALSAVSDADAVAAHVRERHDAFARLARDVKGWARSKGLDSAPFGGLPGLAWAVLAARTVRDADDLRPDALLREFFGSWAAWDWARPVGLTGQASPTAPAPVTVLTPTAPVRSCTPHVTGGFRDLLVQELYRAWELLEDRDPAGLRAAPPLHRRHAAWALLTVPVGAAEGRTRGRANALLAALEKAGVPDAHAWPRPFAADAGALTYAVGLGTSPPDRAALDTIASGWLRGLRGVTLQWAEGGEVPDPA
ncbi:hypothetical protein I3F58_16475 [Streptomyces sp. MUM 203J]|nr:hypothetical protein [Streptomyces sp. MUM 203J]